MMGQKDLLLSNYSIAQPASRGEKGKAPAGYFYDSLTGSVSDCVQAVVLRISPCRTLWGELGERMPECSSYDGVRGNVYGACTNCVYNKWSKDKKDKTCKNGYLLVCANMDTNDSIFMFRAMGMSVRPTKALYTQLVGIGRNTGIPSFGHHVKLETDYQENDLGKFYLIKPMIMGQLTPEETAHYREMYIMLGGSNIAEAEAEGAGSTAMTSADDF